MKPLKIGSDRRRGFYEALRGHLAECGVDLLTAELGRRGPHAVWVVAVKIFGRATTLEVPVSTPDLYAADVAAEVAETVSKIVRSRALPQDLALET